MIIFNFRFFYNKGNAGDNRKVYTVMLVTTEKYIG